MMISRFGLLLLLKPLNDDVKIALNNNLAAQAKK